MCAGEFGLVMVRGKVPALSMTEDEMWREFMQLQKQVAHSMRRIATLYFRSLIRAINRERKLFIAEL